MPSLSRSPMEPPPAAKLAAQSTELCLYPWLSLHQKPAIMEQSVPSSSSWVSSNQNRKRSKVDHSQIIEVENDYDPLFMIIDGNPSDYKNKQPMTFGKILQNQPKVVHREIIEVESDDDTGFVISDGSTSDYKNKQSMSFGKILQNQAKDHLSNKLVGSSTSHAFDGHVAPPAMLESSNWVNSNFYDGISYGDYDYYDDCFEGFESDAVNNNYNSSLSPMFGNAGLPYGVESSIPWLQKFAPVTSSHSQQKIIKDDIGLQFKGVEQYHNFGLATQFDNMVQPPGVTANKTWLQKHAPEMSSQSQQKIMDKDEIDLKFKAFKQFDIVQGDSDHHFAKPGHAKIKKKPSKDWAKRIQHEWKILEKDLPESIHVRVYEDQMDILRAAIIGPPGTPYHDGIFFFDVYFPPNYPKSPPRVHYHSGGLRLNPNLYGCGKVCLSLLGTWGGNGCEKWNPSNSTMLQVLVSIQALVLNEKPYFNEPGYECWANTPDGEQRSLNYNKNTFILSCRTMLYSLRKPPKHFEDFVAGHFLNRGRAILVACRAYLNGAQVGCLVRGVQGVHESYTSYSTDFNSQLRVLFHELLKEFTVLGADCDEFVAHKLKGGSRAAAAADTILKL